MSGTPTHAPGQAPQPRDPTPRRRDALGITYLVLGLLLLLAGMVALASGAYIEAARLHSPDGRPIAWAGGVGMAAGLALLLMARLR